MSKKFSNLSQFLSSSRYFEFGRIFGNLNFNYLFAILKLDEFILIIFWPTFSITIVFYQFFYRIVQTSNIDFWSCRKILNILLSSWYCSIRIEKWSSSVGICISIFGNSQKFEKFQTDQ